MFKIFERTKAFSNLNSSEFEKELKNNRDAVVVDVRTGESSARERFRVG